MRLRAVLTATFTSLALLVGVLAPASSAAAATLVPTVRGPIGDAGIHGHALWDSWFSLEEAGYDEHEYFISGTAKAHGSAQTAPFTTRIVVARPKRADRFNGTVVLDWVNVTAQFENAVDTISAHDLFLRHGYAFVHVSAQAAGICCVPVLTPKMWDPVRYADLSHPGDEYAFDIFTQIARAIRTPKPGTDPMGGLTTQRILAAGQSQSASRLGTYVREVQASAKAIDGFLIHGGSSKVYKREPAAKVFHLLSELEADPEKPNRTKNYHLWEIAGAAHSDFWTGYHQVLGHGPYLLGVGKRDRITDERMHAVAGNYGEIPHPLHAVCVVAGASFPTRYAVSASIHHLNEWVKTGKRPPAAPRFRFDGSSLARDADRNGLGGLRLPPVDVPVATYDTTACALGGLTIPFTTVELLQRYPTHSEYYAKMRAATARSVAAGYLLPTDAKDLLARACRAISRWDPTDGAC